ncbi:nitric oxide synthase oxygenase [Actinosynnema sp. NPDC059335]|uniref:nitric oxide synthase oxygenase n=1 Tax=Actinosynnema sp. NPDC059335 TaxID=3346804 RepID=UPI00366F6B75
MTLVDNGTITFDVDAAEGFLRMFHIAHPEAGPVGPRLARVREEIADTGAYRHTTEELAYGARIALRDSGWCTSGVPWRRLKVRDLRGFRNAAAVAAECVEHLRLATNGGEIRPLVTVFAPDTPTAPGPCVWNEQLVRYAGYGDGSGDRRYREFTEAVRGMGWRPPAPPGRFDLLPLVVETAHEGVKLFTVPPDVVQEVRLEHPDLPWFGELGLRWHAVPVITNMRLVIGGVTYPAAPFNSWFVGSEIGARSLADENAYGAARPVAEALGLDTSTERSLWRDRAVVELNRAVLHSFDRAAVTITDHHAESLHRLSWLRSRQRHAGNRPAFRLDPGAARRAPAGGPGPGGGAPPGAPPPPNSPRRARAAPRGR